MAKVEKEKGKEEKGSGHYSSHFPFFINTLYWRTYHLKLLLFRYFCLHKNK